MHDQTVGLIHLYIGDGKGKTTAAIGLCVRAYGAGKKVLFTQFLKGRETSELTPLRSLGVDVLRTDSVTKFWNTMNESERRECSENCFNLLAYAADAMRDGRYDLVVLDEVLDVVNLGIFTQEQLCSAFEERAASVEIVCTGRNPGRKLTDMADYISEIQALKHPYTRGVSARLGIEY